MASRKLGNSGAKNNKWIKEGRGSGQNSEYKSWITVRDLPSDGRVHRVFGHKSQRTHHLLLELMKIMYDSDHTDLKTIRGIVDYWRVIGDCPANLHCDLKRFFPSL